MRYINGAVALVPSLQREHEDGEWSRSWSKLTFRPIGTSGGVDRRRVKREVRKWVRNALGRSIDNIGLRGIIYGLIPLGGVSPRRGPVRTLKFQPPRVLIDPTEAEQCED